MDTVTKELFDIFRKYHFDSPPEFNTEAREALCLFLKNAKRQKAGSRIKEARTTWPIYTI